MNVRSLRRGDLAFVNRWWPTVSWAGVIFLFSTDYFAAPNTAGFLNSFLTWLFPAITHEQAALIHLWVRKFGHFTEYCIFAVLLMRALNGDPHRRPVRWSAFWTLVTVLAYAASDEFHQSFVPSRSSTVKDVIIDFAGGLAGTLLCYWRHGRGQARSIAFNNRYEPPARQ